MSPDAARPYRHVICGVEGLEQSAPAIAEASRLAAATGARLSLVHVSGTIARFAGGSTRYDRPHDELQAELIVDVHSWLDPVADREGADPVVIVGDAPAQALQDWAAEHDGDVIVICPHRTGLSRLLGSFASDIVRDASCPVLLAPAG